MLRPEQVHAWRTLGFVLVPNLVDVVQPLAEMRQRYPPDTPCTPDFGSGERRQFPFAEPGLNQVTVHPSLLAAVRQLLGTHDIRLIQSVAWAKYGTPSTGPASNRDQRMHMDYGNNMWTHPPTQPDVVAAIVYYSDTRDTGGATTVVPRQPDDPVYTRPFSHMPGIGGLPFANDRQTAEAQMEGKTADIRQVCYARETPVPAPAGSALLYRLDTWHRGTPVRDGQVRYVHNLAWRRGDAPGVSTWNAGFTRTMYDGHFERFIASLTPEQLETLGFPSLDSEIWQSQEMHEAVRARYAWAGFDLDAYLEPPERPEHWFSGSVTWRTTESAPLLRHALLEMFRRFNMHTELTARWTWKLQWCVGAHYLEAECAVMRDGDEYLIDINLWEGDRRVWLIAQRNMQAWWSHGTPPVQEAQVHAHTPDFVYVWLKSEDNLTEALPLVGQQVRPSALLPLLTHECPNVVRMALRALALCQQTFECPPIVLAWAQRNERDFMQREITRWAQRIVAQRSRL